jgi:hypothetical protein
MEFLKGRHSQLRSFLIAINDITKNCLPPIKCNLYADDFNIWCRSNNKSTVQRQLQTTTNNLEKWSKKTGFSFSPEKSSCTIFTKRRKVDKLQITIDKTLIQKKNTVKMLGVLFDRQLSWTPYIKYLKTNTTNAINIMKIHTHTSLGGSTSTLIKIHKSLIQSKQTTEQYYIKLHLTPNLTL